MMKIMRKEPNTHFLNIFNIRIGFEAYTMCRRTFYHSSCNINLPIKHSRLPVVLLLAAVAHHILFALAELHHQSIRYNKN